MSNPAAPVAFPAAHVSPAGAAWLASASCFPRSVHALWALRPGAPSVLPCGTAFDVVTTSPVEGRRLLDRLWGAAGPGSGPASVHQGRMLLFCAPGTAARLPALLDWEEWGRRPEEVRSPRASSLLCHGPGDAVTIPPLHPDPCSSASSRWLVAPDVRHPWLPGPDVVLWAYLRRSRADRGSGAGRGGGGSGLSIFAPPDRGAKVYDVSRRR